MVNEIRKTINPPYRTKDLISIFVALFIMLTIPITVIQVQEQRNNQASAFENSVPSIDSTNDQEQPNISFSSPSNSAYVAGFNYKIVLNASDDVAVKQVDLEIDGTKVASLTSEPFEYDWNLTSTKPGNHTIKATAVDFSEKTQSTSIEIYRGVKQLAN